MPDTIAHARLGRVIYAQLSPGEDLYEAIKEVVRREKIKTGLVLSITGGLSKVRMSMPVKQESVESTPGLIELSGTAEASGHGLIGQTMDSWASPSSGIFNQAGEPYVHVHLTVTVAGKTYCGHLIEGCVVRSLVEKSHFTIALAEVEGAVLNFCVNRTTTAAYPSGIPYHELIEVRG